MRNVLDNYSLLLFYENDNRDSWCFYRETLNEALEVMCEAIKKNQEAIKRTNDCICPCTTRKIARFEVYKLGKKWKDDRLIGIINV